MGCYSSKQSSKQSAKRSPTRSNDKQKAVSLSELPDVSQYSNSKQKEVLTIIDTNQLPTSKHKHSYQRPAYSKKAIRWLEMVMTTEQIYIQHAENGGEYRVQLTRGKFLSFDGYCRETNTVYEFYGDFWHGNPRVYRSNELNAVTRTTYGHLYQRTLEREQMIKSMNFKLVTMWESDFDSLT